MRRYEILLPLKYNDGTDVEIEKFELTQQELIAVFGAITVDTAPVRGYWIDKETLYEDKAMRFYIDTDDSERIISFFKEYKEKLKERFKQTDVWLVMHDLNVL